MKILGINDGYVSTAALIEDGVITRMISEERFNREKNSSGFPQKSIEWIFEDTGLSANDIDALGFATRSVTIKSGSPFNTGRHLLFSSLSKLLPGLISSDKVINFGVERLAQKREQNLDQNALAELGLQNKPRSFYDHHKTHAAAAFYASNFKDKHTQTLVITYDGSGDGLCSTVSIVEKGILKRIHTINSFHSLALLYTRITQFLGMKPLEHEYKLMGMAPYSDNKRAQQVRDILATYIQNSEDGLSMLNISRTWGDSMLKKLQKDLAGLRFDWVAGGMQLFFEERMMCYISSWIKKTGINNLILGGGAFMNVKLNMLLTESDLLNDFYVLPSCGDDSIALGAAYLKNEELSPGTSSPLSHLYLGHECSETEIIDALKTYSTEINYKKVDNIEKECAQLLSEEKIISRCRGRMEWGARALGNRSILANPGNMQVINRINKAIKMRDFWMPFCPSILEEFGDDYLCNDKQLDAPYMILAFNSTESGRKHIPAGLHPFDQTARPQLVSKEFNPRYHYLISEFEKLTGTGGLLNTSLNLHGFPVDCTAKDCINTLVNSDIDFLALEDFLVWKKE